MTRRKDYDRISTKVCLRNFMGLYQQDDNLEDNKKLGIVDRISSLQIAFLHYRNLK